MSGDSLELVLERRGSVLVLRPNRRDARNALTPRLLRAIRAAVLKAESDVRPAWSLITGHR